MKELKVATSNPQALVQAYSEWINDEDITNAKIAKKVDVSESTVARWVRTFHDALEKNISVSRFAEIQGLNPDDWPDNRLYAADSAPLF